MNTTHKQPGLFDNSELIATCDSSIHIPDNKLLFVDHLDEHTGNIGDLNLSLSQETSKPLKEINSILAKYV
ncbi:MAG: hypothetical protein GQ570_04150 [Helicobacteraceae bacterium]|nr:hypothetical protein [Helicobacteraceae bacterium]